MKARKSGHLESVVLNVEPELMPIIGASFGESSRNALGAQASNIHDCSPFGNLRLEDQSACNIPNSTMMQPYASAKELFDRLTVRHEVAAHRRRSRGLERGRGQSARAAELLRTVPGPNDLIPSAAR
jgi:hypothetical protein